MNEETPDLSPMSSPANDVRKLKRNSAAAAGELMGWLEEMRGKSPREVLGRVAGSNLVRSIFEAAFLLAFLILLWTAADWGWETYGARVKGKIFPAAAADPAADPAAPPEEPAEDTAPAEPAPVPDNVANPATAEMPDLGMEEKREISEKLGVGDVREAPANVNPLDDSGDDLLKGLE